MTETQRELRNMIVVGVDGGEDSDRAIRYGVAEAMRTGKGIRLVHVLPETVAMTPMLPMFSADSLKSVGTQILRDGVATIDGLGGEKIRTETVLAHGPQTSAFLAHTQDASMIVLGRRSSTFAHIRTGSTTTSIASRAACPVVAVPEEWEGAEVRQRVVAAIDLTPVANDVLTAGFEAAHDRGADLAVLYAWRPTPPYDTVAGTPRDAEAWYRQTEPVVWEQVAGLRGDYPEVEVQVILRYERPVDALVDIGRDADLMVMGRHREGAPYVMALGAKARALMRAAVCPVEIVPSSQLAPQMPRQAEARDVASSTHRVS